MVSHVLLLLLFIFLFFVKFVQGSDEEFRLLKDLRKNYDPLERPVYNSSLPLTVKLRVYLQQILDVDEKNQVVSLVVWTQFTWNDYKLRWSPEEYGGIKDIRYPRDSSNIWKPDILLYNSADEKFDSTFPVNYVIDHSGDVLQAPPGIVKCSCEIDITWFPFDDQICFLKFGSWTYSVMKLNLTIDKDGLNDTHQMDMKYYIENGEWDLLRTPASREEDPFAEEPYVQLHFYFHIRRRTLYYGLNWIIPSVLISLMTVLGFTLPPEAGEKITLEITILLSVCLYLGMVAEVAPPTSKAVPLIAAFFSCCMMVVSASVVFTVLVLNLHHRAPGSHIMNPTMRCVLLEWMPWLLLMRRPGRLFRKPHLPHFISESANRQEDSVIATLMPRIDSKALMKNLSKNNDNKKQNSVEQEKLIENGFRNEDVHVHCASCNQQSFDQGVVVDMQISPPEKRLFFRNSPSALSALRSGTLADGMQVLMVEVSQIAIHVRRLNDQLRFVTERMRDEDEKEEGQSDWKFAAMVVDRFCLFLFSSFIVVSTCGIMFSAPHLSA